MSVRTSTTETRTSDSRTPSAAPSAGRLLAGGLAAVAVAAVATFVVALVGEAAGAELTIAEEKIPAGGFPVLTVVFGAIGVLIALGLARWARRPRTTFVRTTLVLLALSLVPDVLIDSSAATRSVLALAHLVAAAIVIPALARRLPA